MRRFTWFVVWLLPSFLFCDAAFAQNSGIDHRFGDDGIASISDPQDANTALSAFVSCGMPNGQLRLVAAPDAIQIGSVLVDANGNVASRVTRISVFMAAAGNGERAIGACMGDGRIVIAREIFSDSGERQLQILRLRSDGSLDPGFGSGGESLVDMDAYSSTLTDAETPVGINLEADGGVLVSMALSVNGSVTDAGLVRLSANGLVRFARHYSTLPNMAPGGSTLYASAAGVGADGRVWMAGTATLAGATPVFRVRLDGTTGMVVDAPVYGSGSDSVYAGGGRLLADGSTMVLAARSTFDNLRYLPCLIVIRGNEVSRLALPEPFAIAGSPATAPSTMSLSTGTVIPTGEGRLLIVDALARMADGSAPLATYLALVQLGTTTAGDQVDAHFGIAGRTQFAWRGMQICNNDAPPPQRPIHATNWRGRPVVTGWHSRTCDWNNRRGLLARVQNAGDLFAHGFE